MKMSAKKSLVTALTVGFLSGVFALSAQAEHKGHYKHSSYKCAHHKVCTKDKCHHAKSCSKLAVDKKGKAKLMHKTNQHMHLKK